MDSRRNKTKSRKLIAKSISILEFILGIVVVSGTAWYLFSSLNSLIAQGFSPAFFEVFIGILLTSIIGIEVARVLVTHNLMGVLELLAFVMARKVLEPGITTSDVLIVVLAFGILVYVRKLLCDQKVINPYEESEARP